MSMEKTVVWRKSSRSNDQSLGCCVELASFGAERAIRDSKNPTGPRLHMSIDALKVFIEEIKRDAYRL